MNLEDLNKQELIERIKVLNQELISHKELNKSLEILEMINLAQTDFITVDSENNIFHKMLEIFLSVTESEYGFIDELFYKEDGTMYLEARSITNIAWDKDSHAIYDQLVSGEITFSNMKSLYGEVLKTGNIFISNDAPNDPKGAGIPKGHPPLNAFMGIPLHAGGDFVGIIGLSNKPGGYDKKLIQYLEPLIKICSIIMLSFKTEQKRKAVQKELIVDKKKLEELVNKLEKTSRFKSQFVANVSHELRTPLNSLLLLSQVLLENQSGNLTEKQIKSSRIINQGGKDLLAIINDILDLNKIESGKLDLEIKEVCVKDLIKPLQDMYTPFALSKGINLNFNIDKNVPNEIRTDRKKIIQSLTNLLSNALKYSDVDGVVSMTIQKAPSNLPFCKSQAEGAIVLAFTVSDKGIGIPKEFHEIIFESFQQVDGSTSRKYGGTGLGLTISREFIRLLEGEIVVESKLGAGATFTILLPLK